MDLFEIHRRIRLSLNKDDTGYLTSEEIDRALDRAQLQEYRHLYGDDRKLPQSPLAYGMTLKIHTDLLPFKRTIEFNNQTYNPNTNPTGTFPNGVIDLPIDYLYPVSMISTYQNIKRSVKIVSEDEIGIRLSSVMRTPTFSRPIAVLGGRESSAGIDVTGIDRIQLFPEGGHNVTITYLKRPDTPKLIGLVENRKFTYYANLSTQMEWNDTAIDRIIERSIAILGENMQEDKIGNDNFQKSQV